MRALFCLFFWSALTFLSQVQCGAVYREFREIGAEKAARVILEKQPQAVGDNYVSELRKDQIPVQVIEVGEPVVLLKQSEDESLAESGAIPNEIISEDSFKEKERAKLDKQRIKDEFIEEKKKEKNENKNKITESEVNEEQVSQLQSDAPAAFADDAIAKGPSLVAASDSIQPNVRQAAVPTNQPPAVLIPQPTTPGFIQAFGQNLFQSIQNTTNRLNSTIQGFQQQLLSAFNNQNQQSSPAVAVDAIATTERQPQNPLQSVVSFLSGGGVPPSANPLQGIFNIFNRPQAIPLTAATPASTSPAAASVAALVATPDTGAVVSVVGSTVDDKIDPNQSARTEEDQSISQSDELIIVNDDVSKE